MQHGFKRILVAIRDIEGLSSATLRKVTALARSSEATVELFHAITEPELIQTVWRDRSGRSADVIFQTIESKTNSRLSRLARTGRVARKVRARILVMGALARSSEMRDFIGNTAEQILEHVASNVLVIKPSGFKTVVRLKVASRPRSPV